MRIQRVQRRVRTKNELDRLSEFLMDEILSTPDENLLREAVEEFGDLRTFEAEMANVVIGNPSEPASRK